MLILFIIINTFVDFISFGHCMYKCTCLLQPNLLGSKRNSGEVSHLIYNGTLGAYSRKSKYRSYGASFEYTLAFKMATKAKSTHPGDFNTITLLCYDKYNCT